MWENIEVVEDLLFKYIVSEFENMFEKNEYALFECN